MNLDPVLSILDNFQSTNYEIHEELGRGASGIVFRAKDRSANGSFALKLIRSPSNSENAARLNREIEYLIRLNHPNIVSIIDKGVIKDHVFIVTNLVEGYCLADLFTETPSLIASYWLGDLKSDWSRLATWGKEIGNALEYLHSHNIYHGSLKPTNVLVDREGRCLITDFGLSMLVDYDFEGSHGGGVASFLRYRALEQLCGVVDQRSDVYSLGRILYELACIVGERPSHGYNRIELPPICDVNPNVPTDLGQVIDKACDKVAERRYQDIRELVAVLQRFLEGKSPCDRRFPGNRMSDQEFKMLQKRKNRQFLLGTFGVFALSFVSVLGFNVISKKSETKKPNLPLTTESGTSESQQTTAIDINTNNTDSKEAISENSKSAIDENSHNSPDLQPENEPTKPREPEEPPDGFHGQSHNTSAKILALVPTLSSSGLSQEEKIQGLQTLERFAKTVLNNEIPTEEAERLLAALFLGNIPKLEQMTEIQVPERAFASWLKLVQQQFETQSQTQNAPPTNS